MSAYDIARRMVGMAEIPGPQSHPMIDWAFREAGLPGARDDTAWCGAFRTLCGRLAGETPPAKPARARSWLLWGEAVAISNAARGDTVILQRGNGPQPGADVIDAQGHVGFVSAMFPGAQEIEVLGGNQGDRVSFQRFPLVRVLGVRRRP